ncbi:MAG: group III truncated hemoglobin [Pseudomonadota bacterium]
MQDRREIATRKISDETGITDAMIHDVVHGFYDRVRADTVLGPIFAEKITDWDFHLDRMCTFWGSVALAKGAYDGRPMQKHMPLAIDRHHFDRWLELFASTLNDLCPPAAARHFMERALRIAQSFELGIAAHNGVILGKGERYDPNPVKPWTP